MDYNTATLAIKTLAIKLIQTESTERQAKLQTILDDGKTAYADKTWKDDGGPPANIKDDLRSEDTSQQIRLTNITIEQQYEDKAIIGETQEEYMEQVYVYATRIEKIVNDIYTQQIKSSWNAFYQAYGSSNYPTAISAGVAYKDAIKNHEKSTVNWINSIDFTYA
jgi:hypothetical protein